MKKHIPWIIIAILLIFQFSNCRHSPTTTITTPEKKGTLAAVENPVPEKPAKPIYIYLTGKTKTDTVTVENPVNENLLAYYTNAEASKKDSLYADAIGEREYSIPLDDSLIITNNYIKAQGKVLAFKQSYVIKPQKVAIKQRETAFRMLGGFEVGNTLQLNDAGAKANLMFQNKKGNILSFSYDTDQRIWVGYSFSIWNIKN